MKRLKGKYLLFLVGVLVIGSYACEALAVTAQQIADSVIDELNNVSDYGASVDIDYSLPSLNDSSDGILKEKRNGSGYPKIRMMLGAPWTEGLKTDGSSGFNVYTPQEQVECRYSTMSFGSAWARDKLALDMFNMEKILNDETWTKADSNETIDSVECYKIYTTKGSSNYEVWVDTATMEKVMRVKATDESDDLQWQLDYSNYSDIEDTAQLPARIVTKHYDALGEEDCSATYDFSSIDINQGLSNSIFYVHQ